jgi:hypothetical protein
MIMTTSPASDSSSSASVTPAIDAPVMGSPDASASASSVTPDSKASDTTISIEEAQRRIAELTQKLSSKEQEADRHYKAAKKLQDAEAQKEKERQEATLSEVEKATKRAADAEAKIQSYQKQLVVSQIQYAAQTKGIIDPELAAMAVQSLLEYGDDGMPTNLDKALDALIKSKPYLAPKPAETPPATPAQTASSPSAPQVPAMNPGRSSIAPPPATPGKPMTLSQYFTEQGKR